MNIELTVFQGSAGDHNTLAIPGAAAISRILSCQFGQQCPVWCHEQRQQEFGGSIHYRIRRQTEVLSPVSLTVVKAHDAAT